MSKNTKKAKRENGAGSINYLEKRNRWCANIQIGYNAKTGNPKRKAIYGKTEAEVKRKLKEFKKHMYSKKESTNSNMTLSKFLKYWFLEYKLNEIKPSYYDRLESVFIHHIEPTIGNISLCDLTNADIQKLINDANEAGYARASIKKIAEILQPALKVAVDIEHLRDKSPFDGVKIPTEDKMKKSTREIIVYSEAQKEKMYAKIDEEFKNNILCTHRYFPAFSFILNTGLREGELLGLKWKHLKKTEAGHTVAVIFENITYVYDRDADGTPIRKILNTGKLKGKCKKREVPLNDNALKALEQIKQSNELL
ncbi:MAG: site-specific integrase [Clostridium sp.]|uniref:tyrosine-type recombinase/integrase n=1 Tax=Clostridium TaxID=1485 RepID=UPI0029034120|nr:site-specific integrase [Clostridium sp.]MDU1602873.1 site-specific integrase [Clostridium sp.]